MSLDFPATASRYMAVIKVSVLVLIVSVDSSNLCGTINSYYTPHHRTPHIEKLTLGITMHCNFGDEQVTLAWPALLAISHDRYLGIKFSNISSCAANAWGSNAHTVLSYGYGLDFEQITLVQQWYRIPAKTTETTRLSLIVCAAECHVQACQLSHRPDTSSALWRHKKVRWCDNPSSRHKHGCNQAHNWNHFQGRCSLSVHLLLIISDAYWTSPLMSAALTYSYQNATQAKAGNILPVRTARAP